MKGEQETKMVVEVEEEDDYEQKLEFVNPIAKPMANKKLVKRLFKCIKKGKCVAIIFLLRENHQFNQALES